MNKVDKWMDKWMDITPFAGGMIGAIVGGAIAEDIEDAMIHSLFGGCIGMAFGFTWILFPFALIGGFAYGVTRGSKYVYQHMKAKRDTIANGAKEHR